MILLTSGSLFSQEDQTASTNAIDSIYKRAYKFQTEYKVKESLEELSKIIDLALTSNDTYYQALAYNLIGANYENIRDFESAEKNYKKALYNTIKSKNDTLRSWVYNNLGNVYGDGFKNIEKGIEYYKKSLVIAEHYKDTVGVLTAVLNIGWTYIDADEFDNGLPYLMRVKGLLDSYEDDDTRFFMNYLFGIYYSNSGDIERAEENFCKAIALSENKTYLREMQDLYQALYKHYKATGDIVKAFEALEKHNDYRDRLFNEDNIKQLEIAKARFDVDEYKRDLELAKTEKAVQEKIATKSRQTGIITGISSFVLFILLILLFINGREKIRINKMLKTRNDELELAKIEAERLSNVKSQFIATVSHELRTPLYGVVGLTSLLLEEQNLGERENQYLKSLKFSGDYLLNLINDVLQLSKIDSNKIVLSHSTFNICTLTKDISDSFGFNADQRHNRIHFYFDESIPTMVKGDPVRLSQILINLIGNATKFNANGNVWISITEENRNENDVFLKFMIKDDGPGIPLERQEEIFENFSQLQRGSNDYHGTGLGLSIVKKLIALMGSEIVLKSDVGEGAEFSFVLKFEMDTEVAYSEIDVNEKYLSKQKNKVLIAEDNRINQIVTQNILQKSNFECVVVSDGFEAVKAMKENEFDLVLMDLNMPNLNGADATRKIREFNTKTPIIALTALQVDALNIDIHNVGINDVINKPYDKHEFHQVIIKNLNGKLKN